MCERVRPSRERPGPEITVLDMLLEKARERFYSTEFYKERDGSFKPYFPLQAIWDVVEDLRLPIGDLVFLLSRETLVPFSKVNRSVLMERADEAETWEEFYNSVAKAILDTEMSERYPELEEEYKRRSANSE